MTNDVFCCVTGSRRGLWEEIYANAQVRFYIVVYKMPFCTVLAKTDKLSKHSQGKLFIPIHGLSEGMILKS